MPTLPELLSQSKSDIEEISKYFNELLAKAIQRVNANFSPQRLSKRTRQVEPLPTDKRQRILHNFLRQGAKSIVCVVIRCF